MKRILMVVLAAALVAACTPTGRVAATVGDVAISADDVEFLAQAQCQLLNRQESGEAVPNDRIRTGMTNALIDYEIQRRIAERGDGTYDSEALSRALADGRAAIAVLAEEDRERYSEILENAIRAQLQVAAMVDGSAQLFEEAVMAERAEVEIQVNPRYGSGESLSVAVSDMARSALAPPDAAWVLSLPRDQYCLPRA